MQEQMSKLKCGNNISGEKEDKVLMKCRHQNSSELPNILTCEQINANKSIIQIFFKKKKERKRERRVIDLTQKLIQWCTCKQNPVVDHNYCNMRVKESERLYITWNPKAKVLITLLMLASKKFKKQRLLEIGFLRQLMMKSNQSVVLHDVFWSW